VERAGIEPATSGLQSREDGSDSFFVEVSDGEQGRMGSGDAPIPIAHSPLCARRDQLAFWRRDGVAQRASYRASALVTMKQPG
jgi:hypothetical protein